VSSAGMSSVLWDRRGMPMRAPLTCILQSSSWIPKTVVDGEGGKPISRPCGGGQPGEVEDHLLLYLPCPALGVRNQTGTIGPVCLMRPGCSQ